jgi:hypothetical protein
MADWYQWEGDDLILSLHVQPNAKKDEVTGLHDNRIRLRTSAPPVDGKANKHLLKYLAVEFGVSKTAVSLLSGDSSRIKRLRIKAPKKQPAWFTELSSQA